MVSFTRGLLPGVRFGHLFLTHSHMAFGLGVLHGLFSPPFKSTQLPTETPNPSPGLVFCSSLRSEGPDPNRPQTSFGPVPTRTLSQTKPKPYSKAPKTHAKPSLPHPNTSANLTYPAETLPKIHPETTLTSPNSIQPI